MDQVSLLPQICLSHLQVYNGREVLPSHQGNYKTKGNKLLEKGSIVKAQIRRISFFFQLLLDQMYFFLFVFGHWHRKQYIAIIFCCFFFIIGTGSSIQQQYFWVIGTGSIQLSKDVGFLVTLMKTIILCYFNGNYNRFLVTLIESYISIILLMKFVCSKAVGFFI